MNVFLNGAQAANRLVLNFEFVTSNFIGKSFEALVCGLPRCERIGNSEPYAPITFSSPSSPPSNRYAMLVALWPFERFENPLCASINAVY